MFDKQLENIYHAKMDEMKDFPALVSKIENDHPDAVAFKIIPPPEWKAKYGGYNETSDLIDKKRIYPKLMLSTNLGNEIVQIFNNQPHDIKEKTKHTVKVYPATLYFTHLILKSGCWINCNKSTQFTPFQNFKSEQKKQSLSNKNSSNKELLENCWKTLCGPSPLNKLGQYAMDLPWSPLDLMIKTPDHGNLNQLSSSTLLGRIETPIAVSLNPNCFE
jgi:hypothetical protein